MSEKPGPTKGQLFGIVGFKVLEFVPCTYRHPTTSEEVKTDGEFKEGDSVSIRCNLESEYGPQFLKACAIALMSAYDEDCEMTESEVKLLLDNEEDESFDDAFEEGGFVGLQIQCVTEVGGPRKDGTPFFRNNWKATNRL